MMTKNGRTETIDQADLSNLVRMRGDTKAPPDVSIVIPVNAQGDLRTVLNPLADICRYTGTCKLEVVLVINNYPADNPPGELEEFRSLGAHVVAIPSARRPGEVVIMSARAIGVQAAESEITIHIDADCRIPNINALVDFYRETLGSGSSVAYSHVDYYDLRPHLSVHSKIAIHHIARAVKRNLLGIPTTRGGNYAIRRELFLALYEAGKLSVDLQIGPAAILAGARVAYSNQSSHRVLISGRRLRGGWTKMIRKLPYRLHYNLKAIPRKNHEVTRTSWDGFDQESENRQRMGVPGHQDIASPESG